MSVPSYNIATGVQASYAISEDGKTTVTVQCTPPIKFREIYCGAANLSFYWVSTGKSRSWCFAPTLVDPAPAQHTETMSEDEKTQTLTVDLTGKLFPASGLANTYIDGEIYAPAIHFDIPHAYDLWIFLLRSPWFPLKVAAEKSSLNITHDTASAMAVAESISSEGSNVQSLRVDLSVHGEGFKNVKAVLRRSTSVKSLEEVLGEVASGMDTFTWTPVVRSFDVLLVTSSEPGIARFAEFLQYMGAQVQAGNFFSPTLLADFLLSDGVSIGYSLKLIGEKHILGHEKDETAVTLKA